MESETPYDPQAPQPPLQPAPPPAPETPPRAQAEQAPQAGWTQPALPPRPVWAGPPLASWGSRVGAALLDGLVLLGVGIVLFVPAIVAFVAGSDVAGVILVLLGGLGYLVAALLYAPYFMARPGEQNGQTLGKQWLGIRVVRNTGQAVEIGYGFLREFVIKGLLFGTVGAFLFYIPTLLDCLWPLWDDENRALHDMVASSHVVQA